MSNEGEWTIEQQGTRNVWELRCGVKLIITSTHYSMMQLVADAHNAALAANDDWWDKNVQRPLRKQLAAAQELMSEVRQWHSDKESPDYNECDTAPCQWCESSLKLGTDCMDAHVRQKTWELQKQLAAEVEKVNKLEGWCEQLQPHYDAVADLQKQLAAERETLKKRI